MSKKKFYNLNLSIPAPFRREDIRLNYERKVFNWFCSRFDFPTLDYQASHWIKRKLFYHGSVAEINVFGTPLFTTYAGIRYNTYDFPTEVSLVNHRGIPIIPSTPQEVDKDCVLWWVQRNHSPIWAMVRDKVEMIVNVEMAIAINIQASKTPFMIACDPEVQKSLRAIVNAIESDELAIFLPAGSADRIKALMTGAPYIVDKLVQYREKLENEIKEFLGIKSLPISEKKEHLITDEINVNDEITEFSGDSILDSLKESAKLSKEILGIEIQVQLNEIDAFKEDDETKEEEEIDDESDD